MGRHARPVIEAVAGGSMSRPWKKIAESIERYDEVMEADSEDPDAAHECVAEIRLILEENPTVAAEVSDDAINLNNPIARLQERAQANRTDMPVYSFARSGPDHAPRMMCVCTSEGHRGEGEGPNKQTSKRRAALAVLKKIHGLDP